MVTCSTRAGWWVKPRQRGHRNAKSRFQACADGQVVDGLARSDGKPEAGLAARDERDARVRPADADVDGPRDGGNCRVHQRRLGDAGVPGHRLKLDGLQGAGDALRLDDASDLSGRPAQGSHTQVAQLPLHNRQGVRDLSASTVTAPACPSVSSHEKVKDGLGPCRGRE